MLQQATDGFLMWSCKSERFAATTEQVIDQFCAFFQGNSSFWGHSVQLVR